jgi:hypothetical protein
MTRVLGAAVLFVALVSACARTTAEDPPAVPKAIAVPAGHTVVLTVQAKGVQIYKSVEGKGGKPEWVLDSPLADLTSAKGEKLGSHFGGPTFGGPAWEVADGSRLVRDKAEEVKSVPAPKPEGDIPWLLVRVKSDDGKPGTLARVVYIQRVLTEGGKPPADAPKRLDTRVGVPYKATYVFFAPAK